MRFASLSFRIGTYYHLNGEVRHLCSQVINVRAVVVVILWELDLQLPMQLVPITANVVSSNPAHGKVYSIQCYVIKFVRDSW